MAAFSAMSYSREVQEARALAYVGSLVFSAGLAAFASIAFFCREMLRTIRERRAQNWQAASAQIASGTVTAIPGRFIDYAIANVGYSYSLEGNYYSGYLTRQFWDEQAAWTFADGCREKSVMIQYKPEKPRVSVLRDLELSRTSPMSLSRPFVSHSWFGPRVAILWSLRNVSEWAEKRLEKEAINWPSTEARVDYAEPRISDVDDRPRWVGELHYSYSIDGCCYSSSHYFRAFGEEDAKEQVESWRGRKVIVHYFPGNPARSVFIESEQHPAPVTQPADED
jgi:hypothetical protein